MDFYICCRGCSTCFTCFFKFLLSVLVLGFINFYSNYIGKDPFFKFSLLLKYKKWLYSTPTNAFIKFLNSKLVIIVSSL